MRTAVAVVTSVVIILSLAVRESLAQVVETALTPGPTLTLSVGETPANFNVSSMKVVSGNWAIKPVYEITQTGVHVRGLFVSALPGTVYNQNIGGVWYERPAEDCDSWAVKSWEDASKGVAAIKLAYSIPNDQDSLWEVASISQQPTQGNVYSKGFPVSDPIGDAVNSLDASGRNCAVEALKSWGYAVADIPFEKGSNDTTRAWLISTSRFFDQTIGRNLQGEELRAAVETRYTPPILIDPACEVFLICLDLIVPSAGGLALRRRSMVNGNQMAKRVSAPRLALGLRHAVGSQPMRMARSR